MQGAANPAANEAAEGGLVVPLVFCFDGNFGAYAAAAIASALANADAFYRIYCLFPGEAHEFPAEIVSLCQRYRCELHLVAVPKDAFADWRIDAGTHFSPANYYRLLIPQLIPEDRLIYLDCDLVVTCGLAGLYAHDLQGQWIGGFTDTKGRAGSQMPLAPEEPYVNSGVLLLDVAALREHRPMPVIIDYYKRFEAGVTWVDQCLINKFCEGRKSLLEERWNIQFNNIEEAEVGAAVERFDRRAIFHFSGQTKPWMEWSPNRLTELWKGYARIAGYDVGALMRRAGNLGEFSKLALKHEAEGEWEAAAGTWKSIVGFLHNHIQQAGGR